MKTINLACQPPAFDMAKNVKMQLGLSLYGGLLPWLSLEAAGQSSNQLKREPSLSHGAGTPAESTASR